MAVAVKTSTGPAPSSPLSRPAVASLVGLVYVVGCFLVVFKLIPWLWGQAAEQIGLASGFVSGTVLGLLMLAAAVGLLRAGGRVLGPQAPAGVRAGVFVGLVGLVLSLLLARWASLWIEHWAFTRGSLSPNTGLVISAAVAAGLLALFLWLFLRPGTQRAIQRFEQGGWFHATTYKSNQGVKVRRGTIFGILLLVGAGIYTLLSLGTLKKGAPDWALNIPFTGAIAIDDYGDAESWVAGLDSARKDRVQVRWPGDPDLRLEAKQDLLTAKYREAVKRVLAEEGWDATLRTREAREKLSKMADEAEVTALLDAVNRTIHAEMMALLAERTLRPDTARRLRERDGRIGWADITPLIEEFRREAVAEKQADKLGKAFDLPTAVVVIDRYTLQQEVNAKVATEEELKADKVDSDKYVRVGRLEFDTDLFKLEGGAVVTNFEFDAAVQSAREQVEKRLRRQFPNRWEEEFRQRWGKEIRLPEKLPLVPASGPTQFAALTLLPSVQFTVPLLLLALSLWLAWRIVNMPTFADFLIATEAELNKVSWTTQKRLVQDTIVVLVVTVLLALYLFLMDQGWRILLSSRIVGVLQIPKDQSGATQSIEQKRY